MQTTSTVFEQLASGSLRPLKWQVRAAFSKVFDDAIEFFELDTSLLDGDDVLAPNDNSVIQLWDKYEYDDYSDRVIAVEVQTEQTEPSSVVQAMADITLNNYDGFFTPNSSSAIGAFILPRRPFRVLMGFGNEVVPLFVGLSTKMPQIDKESRTVTFHCIDFLSYLFEQKIDDTTTLIDYSTGEILDYLFQLLGLLPSQYDIDATSFNRINYFYAEKGQTLGDIIRPLMEAEQGRLWLDELGVIRFLNRQNYPTTSVATFDSSNVTDYSDNGESDVINYVKITSKILELQQSQKLWEQALAINIPAGDTIDIWANFDDPVTTVATPTLQTSAIEDSYFSAVLQSDSTVSYADITLNSISYFSKSAKMTFENTGTDEASISALVLWGTPIKVIDILTVEDSDATSIVDFEEQRYELETTYIQDRLDAISKAAIIVDDYKDYASVVELEVKGNPAYQIGDNVTLDVDSYQGNYITTKIINMLRDNRYTQRIAVKARNPREYFILDSSLLDGDDVLSP